MRELIDLYNFHDCYMLFPFKIYDDKIVITFDLSKHLQNEEIKSKYIKLEKEYHHLITVECIGCTYINFIEESFESKTNLIINNRKTIKKEVNFDTFDTNLDFISVCISLESNSFYAYFSDDELKRGHITFNFESITVSNENFVDETTFQELLNQ